MMDAGGVLEGESLPHRPDPGLRMANPRSRSGQATPRRRSSAGWTSCTLHTTRRCRGRSTRPGDTDAADPSRRRPRRGSLELLLGLIRRRARRRDRDAGRLLGDPDRAGAPRGRPALDDRGRSEARGGGARKPRGGGTPGPRHGHRRGGARRPAVARAHAPFDAVFVDADKGNYDAYGRWAAKALRPGGLLLADNVYLFGRLMGKSDEAAAMRRFHEESARAFETVCIPTPDGLLLGVKR